MLQSNPSIRPTGAEIVDDCRRVEAIHLQTANGSISVETSLAHLNDLRRLLARLDVAVEGDLIHQVTTVLKDFTARSEKGSEH
jgi:hypothetical protein